jgi:2-polyprenyl-3-methyl-5-hydroxy-6-metoxy-1,4-benzoquinol methylase
MHSDTLKEEMLTCCPICSATLNGSCREVVVSDPFRIVDRQYSIVECHTCRTWLLNPRPLLEEMSRFYDTDFLADVHKERKSLLEKIAYVQQRVNLVSELRWVDKHLPPGGDYLDYSAGTGQIVRSVRDRRTDVSVRATEFSAPYRKNISTLLGRESVRADISEFGSDGRFDLISAFAVLEHVESPKALLQLLGDHLKDGGKVMLTVPNPESWQKCFMGSRWNSWLPPRHWHLMTMKTIVKLLEDCGYQVVDKKHFFLRTSSSTFVLSLFPSLNPLQEPSKLRLIIYAFLFYGFIPFELVASAFGRAGFMGVVGRKA